MIACLRSGEQVIVTQCSRSASTSSSSRIAPRTVLDRLAAWARCHPDLVASLVLFALTLVLFAPPLLSGRAVSPMNILLARSPWRGVIPLESPPNPALTDVVQMFHPWLVYAGEQIRAGVFPLWNPHEYAGAPFFGNGQSALLFPLTMLAFVLPAAVAVTLIAWVKLLGIGLATYWFLRTLGPRPVPALSAACGFMLGACVVGWLQWTVASTLIWLPLLLGMTERLRERRDGRALVALALVVTLDVLAGYPQATGQALLVTTAWALTRARGAGGWFLARYAAGVVLGVGLAAIHLVPFLQYVGESFVFTYRRQWTPFLSAPLQSATTFLMPYYYGVGQDYWGRWQFAIQNGYAGIVTLAVVPLGVRAAWRRGDGRFFVVLLALALGLHYGLPGIASLAAMPGLSLGTNLRLMPLIAFALCVLTALGLDALRTGRSDRVTAWLLGSWFSAVSALAFVAVARDHVRPEGLKMWLPLPVQLALGLGALTLAMILLGRATAGRTAPGVCVIALAALQIVSLLPLAVGYLPSVERRWFYPSTPAIEYLRREAGRESRVLMPGGVAVVYGLREAQGYDGLSPRRIVELIGPVGTGTPLTQGLLQNTVLLDGSEPLSGIRVLVSPVFDLLAVRYVLLEPGAPPPRPNLSVVYDAADARIFKNDAALPRALIVGDARCVDDATALGVIRNRAVDFRRQVLLAGCAEPPGGISPANASGSTLIHADSANHVAIRTTADRPAYLVLTDTWFPGWTARVDGQPTPVWRANHAFRAVVVPAGEHEVEFRFEPGSLVVGAIISGLSLVVAGVIAWRPA
jgi:hypothetical protein